MHAVETFSSVTPTSHAVPAPWLGAPQRVVIVGSGARATRLAGRLHRLGATIVGAIDDVPQPELFRSRPDVPWLGGIDHLITETVRRHVDELYVALPLRSGFDTWLRVRSIARRLGVPATLEFDLADEDARSQMVPGASGNGLLNYNRHPSQHGPKRFWKRAIDLAGALAALVLCAPILALIVIAIRLDSKGPAIFVQDRVGLSRRRFRMLKFRTMADGAEAHTPHLRTLDPHGVLFKADEDPRVTRVGAWLRRTSLDELPQLVNVIKGEMSLVGPRPMPVWVYDKVPTPEFHRRSSVKPGMTGLWQVTGREQNLDGLTRRDLEYVEGWSMWEDLCLLLRTPAAVIRGDGAR